MGYIAHTPPCSTLGISLGRTGFILLYYKMNKNKYTIISALIVGLLLSLLCLGSTLLGKSEPSNTNLKRLDEISKELAQVSSEVKETEIQIANLNVHLSELKDKEASLNGEATSIFYKMMSPEMFEFKDSNWWVVACYGCSHYDSWLDACVEWDKRSRRCEANFPTDTLDKWVDPIEWEPWLLNEDWTQQVMPEVTGETSHDKFKSLANSYWLNASTIWEVENHYWIKEWVILCITVAETSGWNRWAGWKNIWSVGSNDRGDRPVYALMESWLEAIGKTLNNKYLWQHQTLWCLSNAGHCTEWLTARYATSDGNRERNMVACLSSIYGNIDPATFSIRR